MWFNLVLIALSAIVFIVLVGLGTWQLERLAWKRDLIETVELRAYSDPVEAPTASTDLEYLRVTFSGIYQHDFSLLIKAVTELGSGQWLMTPLRGADQTIWINRGFVPSKQDPAEWTRPTGRISVTGLVRLSRPDGTFLENNEPNKGRWVSPDIDEMSRHSGLKTASYYIDAAHSGSPESWPRGGMTRLAFRNAHLSYALTWYTMAALFFAAMIFVIHQTVRAYRPRDPNK